MKWSKFHSASQRVLLSLIVGTIIATLTYGLLFLVFLVLSLLGMPGDLHLLTLVIGTTGGIVTGAGSFRWVYKTVEIPEP
jgi:hypothetical protein